MNQRGDMSENYYSDMIDVKGSKAAWNLKHLQNKKSGKAGLL